MCSFDLLASYVEQQAGALGISIPPGSVGDGI